MKKEFHLYLVIIFLILITGFFEFHSNIFQKKEQKAGLNTLTTFEQLLVEVDCNIFMIEGESQNVLLEGPEDKLKNIETLNNKGYVTIRQKGETILSNLLDLFGKNGEKINVYITVTNFDEFNILTAENSLNIKYSSDDRIGLILQKGQRLIIESKKFDSCV